MTWFVNPVLAALEWVTRPRVVLGLRVAWDFAFGAFLLLVVDGILAYRGDVVLVALGTIAAGAWTLAAELRTKKVSP